MKMMFEDNPNSELSRLILAAYKPEETDSILFTKGDGNVINVLESMVCDTEDIVLFVDVVPNNVSTCIAYRKIHKYVRRFVRDKHVFMFPIPCIEYYALQCFDSRRFVPITTALDKNLYPIGVNSAENYYSYLLCNGDACIATGKAREYRINFDPMAVYGAYYHKHCLCVSPHVTCTPITIQCKAESLLRLLPVHLLFREDTSKVLTSVEIAARCDQWVDMYNVCARDYVRVSGQPAWVLNTVIIPKQLWVFD